MNCRHVQELLPLYVARDLEENRAQMVSEHLQSCAQCAGSAEEYRETRQLLQQFTPPPFSEAVYAGMRRRVLRDIGRESPKSIAPALPKFVASLFRPRLTWAIASALLLAVSVFAFYFITNKKDDRQQVAGSGRTVDRPTLIKESKGLPPASTVENRGPVQGLAGGTHQPQRKRTGGAPDRTRPATVNSADTRSMSAEAAAERNNPAEPNAFPASDPATSEKALRVEMQTKDPNIRIIWFTPQPTKQDSPSKFFKGI